MIIYFSATGNSKWIAESLAKALDDKAVDVVNNLEETVGIESEERVGIVFPIYAWGAPKFFLEILKTLPKPKGFTFAVCTCGQDAGKAISKLNKIIPIDSAYSVIMPSNFVTGADLESDAVIKKKIEEAKIRTEKIADEIKSGKKVYDVIEGGVAALKSSVANWGFSNFMGRTKSFTVDDTCISCGLCQIVCPAKTITIKNRKPEWGEKCYVCTACINKCPKKAIQYGEKTRKRGRYNIKDWV